MYKRQSVLCILKDLSRQRVSKKDDNPETSSISEELSKLGIDEDQKPKKGSIKYYIQLDSSKMAAVHECCLQTIRDSFTANAKKSEILLLSTYLNFFIVLREQWDRNLLQIVYSMIDSTLEQLESDKLSNYKEIAEANKSLKYHLNTMK